MEDNLPVNVQEYQKLAKKALSRMHYDYINGGAENEHTLRENIAAYGRILLRPRVLIDVSKIDMSTSLLGYNMPSPIIVAPTGSHKLANPEGEVATARAAAACNTIMVLSFTSSCRIEEVASSCDAIRFYQLYVCKRRDVSATLVRRAESLGFKALVLTVDRPVLGRREADTRNKMTAPRFVNLEGLMSLDGDIDGVEGGSKMKRFSGGILDPSLSWKDVVWLKSITSLPILLKGILTAEDGVLKLFNMASGPHISPSFCNSVKEILQKHKTPSANMSQPSASGADHQGGGHASSTQTPEIVVVHPLAMSPPWMANEMRHPPLRTPPTTVGKEAMITPEVQEIYCHHDQLGERFVPNKDHKFDDLEEAYQFYRVYAELAGFPIKKNRTRGEGQDFCCSFEGKHVPNVTEDDRKREKTSKRDGCKAMVCANKRKGSDQFSYTRILLGHNHKLNPEQKMTKRMHSHKVLDPTTMGVVNILHQSHVPHAKVMSVLRNVVGGAENLNLTERDVQNRHVLLPFDPCLNTPTSPAYTFEIRAQKVFKGPTCAHKFDRNDRMLIGQDGDTKARRTYSILQDFYKLMQKAVMSEEGHSRCKQIIKDAHNVIDPIPHDIGPLAGVNATSSAVNEQEDDANISSIAPPISTTKGSRKRMLGNNDVPEPHFKRKSPPKRTRRCSNCNQTGHKITTCGRPAAAPKRPRGRPFGTSRGRGRFKCSRGRDNDTGSDNNSTEDDSTPSTSED